MKRRRRRRRKENMKTVCAAWSLLFAGCMAVMLVFASKKAIVIADMPQEQTGLSVNLPPEDIVRETELRLEGEKGVRRSFCIPLPRSMKAENVVMENRYLTKELWLYIQGGEPGFFAEHSVSGDISLLRSGRCEEQENGVILKLFMDQVMEYRSTLESGVLTIAWYEPHELYDYVVILDPAWEDGEKQKEDRKDAEISREEGKDGENARGDREVPFGDITLQVAKHVQKRFPLERVRLYLVRPEDRETAPGDRIAFAEAVEADLYLRLGLSRADTEESYGIQGFYNEEYFIPGFGNADLADLVTRSVTVSASNRAVGLECAGEESILKKLKMPAAEVSLGYLSNPLENYLLGQETYQEKLAEGCITAISQAVEALKEAGK